MRRITAQRFLIASGILALLGGGSCFLAFNVPRLGDNGPILVGLSGLGALGIAVILFLVGVIGLLTSRRDN
jgi:hypothetical protein